MTEFWNSVVTIAIAIIGIAGLAIIVSQRANTSQVITSGAQGLATALSAAEAPVTGGGSSSLSSLNLGSSGAGYI